MKNLFLLVCLITFISSCDQLGFKRELRGTYYLKTDDLVENKEVSKFWDILIQGISLEFRGGNKVVLHIKSLLGLGDENHIYDYEKFDDKIYIKLDGEQFCLKVIDSKTLELEQEENSISQAFFGNNKWIFIKDFQPKERKEKQYKTNHKSDNISKPKTNIETEFDIPEIEESDSIDIPIEEKENEE